MLPSAGFHDTDNLEFSTEIRVCWNKLLSEGDFIHQYVHIRLHKVSLAFKQFPTFKIVTYKENHIEKGKKAALSASARKISTSNKSFNLWSAKTTK